MSASDAAVGKKPERWVIECTHPTDGWQVVASGRSLVRACICLFIAGKASCGRTIRVVWR